MASHEMEKNISKKRLQTLGITTFCLEVAGGLFAVFPTGQTLALSTCCWVSLVFVLSGCVSTCVWGFLLVWGFCCCCFEFWKQKIFVAHTGLECLGASNLPPSSDCSVKCVKGPEDRGLPTVSELQLSSVYTADMVHLICLPAQEPESDSADCVLPGD